MKTLRISLAAALALVASASVADEAITRPRIKNNDEVCLTADLCIGKKSGTALDVSAMLAMPLAIGAVARSLQSWARDGQSLLSFAGADPLGISSSGGALAAAIADKPHVIVPSGNFRITSNMTVPASVTLDFQGGACLAPASGVTVTILGPIRAPLSRIFCGAGAIAGLKEGHPEWWGADGTAANDTAATVASLAASNTTALTSRRYRFKSGLLTATEGKALQGTFDGVNGTVIEAVDPTGDVLTFVDNAEGRGLYFTAAAQRTGGCYARFNGTPGGGRGRLTNWQAWLYYDGVCISDGADSLDITNGKLMGGKRRGIAVDGGFNVIIDNIYALADASQQPEACIYVTAVGDLTIRGSRLTTCGVPLFADVADGKYVSSLETSDTYLDTSKYSLRLRSQGTGIITRASFVNLWGGNAINEGVLIENTGTGKIADVAFVHPRLTFNGHSAFKTVGEVSALTITAPVAYGNGKCLMANPGSLPCATGTPGQYAAFDFSAGTTFTMVNPWIGATSEGPGNTAAIKAVAGTTGTITGGTIGTNDVGLQDSSGAAGVRYVGVTGVRTSLRKQITVPVGSTSTTVAHGLAWAPSPGDWTVTFDSNPGASGVSACYVSGWDATNVTVACNGTVTGNAPFLTLSIELAKGRAN